MKKKIQNVGIRVTVSPSIATRLRLAQAYACQKKNGKFVSLSSILRRTLQKGLKVQAL